MVTPGGEVAFVGRMIEDSMHLREQIRWYTSMVRLCCVHRMPWELSAMCARELKQRSRSFSAACCVWRSSGARTAYAGF